LEEGQRAAADAVRRFLDAVEGAMPRPEGSPNRQEIVDSALEMAERLIQTQYDILRRAVQSAGRTLSDSTRGG
jgi:flagellar hook-associated protein FlgK